MTIDENIRPGRGPLPEPEVPARAPAGEDVDYRRLFDEIDEGFCVIEVQFDADGRATDYLFVETNRLFGQHTGLADAAGKTARELVPNLEDSWFETYGRIVVTGKAERFESGSEVMGRWFDVYAAPFGPTEKRQVAIVFRDVTERKRATAALESAEERARLAIGLARVGTWTFDVAAQTALLDERMCAIWGRGAGEAEITYDEAFAEVHPEDRTRVAEALAGALDPAGDGAYAIEYRLVWRDGSVHWIATTGRTTFAGAGVSRRAETLLGTAIDITERRRAEDVLRASEDRLTEQLRDTRALQSLSSQFITQDDTAPLYDAILDAAMVLMRSDMASMQMLVPERNELKLIAWRNFKPVSAAGWAWVAAGPDTTCGQALAARQRVIIEDIEAADADLSDEGVADYRIGGIRAVQSTPLVSRTGAVLGMLSTHWREPHVVSERELSLLDVVARQASDLFERLAAEAELLRALSAKDEFLGLVSHELRTPITTVLGNANVLMRLGDDLGAEERGAALEDIRDHAERLGRIVDDLLALARAERGVLEREPIVLGRAVRKVVEDYRTDTQVPIALRGDWPSLIVDGENGMLVQVLRNFLSNAERYGSGSAIEVEVSREGGDLVVRVMDRGIGIDVREAERLFEPFYRSPAVRATGGLGIGLSVCKRLAEAVGGRVWGEQRQGGGSVFALALPLHVEDGGAVPAAGEDA